MSFAQGVAFRNSAGFVTDPTNYTHDTSSGTVDYPTVLSPSGVNGGWETISGSGRPTPADRSAYTGLAAACSGIAYCAHGDGTQVYRMDLPATGNYDLGLAFGDATSGHGASTVTFKDTSTVVATPVNNVGTSAADHFIDATGVERTSHSDWATNQALLTNQSFATTIYRMSMVSNVDYAAIASLYVQASTGVAFTAFIDGAQNQPPWSRPQPLAYDTL